MIAGLARRWGPSSGVGRHGRTSSLEGHFGRPNGDFPLPDGFPPLNAGKSVASARAGSAQFGKIRPAGAALYPGVRVSIASESRPAVSARWPRCDDGYHLRNRYTEMARVFSYNLFLGPNSEIAVSSDSRALCPSSFRLAAGS